VESLAQLPSKYIEGWEKTVLLGDKSCQRRMKLRGEEPIEATSAKARMCLGNLIQCIPFLPLFLCVETHLSKLSILPENAIQDKQ
jgi:hypothetical protein